MVKVGTILIKLFHGQSKSWTFYQTQLMSYAEQNQGKPRNTATASDSAHHDMLKQLSLIMHTMEKICLSV